MKMKVLTIPGLKFEDFQQNSKLCCQLIHPDDIQNYKEILNNLSHAKLYSGEYRINDYKGQYKWINDRITPVKDSQLLLPM